MPRRRTTLLFVVFCFLLGAAAVLAPYFLSGQSPFRPDPRVAVTADNCYTQTLRVVADRDYAPYSFYDDSRVMSGHDVELIAEVANRLGMNLDLRLMSWSSALKAVDTGQADIVMGAEMVYLGPGREKLVMSVPIVSDPFVVFGTERAVDVSSLYGKHIAVIEQSGAGSIIDAYHLESYCHAYKSYTDAFRSVAAGENEFVICRYSVGRLICDQLRARSIDPTGVVLFDNYLCFGMAADAPELKELVDQALVSLIADGSLSRLQSKWLGSYVKVLSLSDYLRANSLLVTAYAAAMALLVLGYFIYFALRSRRIEADLTLRAEHDTLTGLLNRGSAEAQMRHTLISSPPVVSHALFIIDVDEFKNINDTRGHMEGDLVLRSLADILRRSFREEDIVGRMGGDEFFVLMKNVSGIDAVSEKAASLCSAFRGCYGADRALLPVTVSAGVAVFPEHGGDFDTLYKKADSALYASKDGKKDSCRVFSRDVGSP